MSVNNTLVHVNAGRGHAGGSIERSSESAYLVFAQTEDCLHILQVALSYFLLIDGLSLNHLGSVQLSSSIECLLSHQLPAVVLVAQELVHAQSTQLHRTSFHCHTLFQGYVRILQCLTLGVSTIYQ